MKDKKDNVFVNIIIFIAIIVVIYYVVVMPEDFPLHMQMAGDGISHLVGGLTK